MRIEVYEDAAGETRWRVKADNNRVVADSGEGYQNRSDAVDEARRLFGEDVEVVEVASAPPAA